MVSAETPESAPNGVRRLVVGSRRDRAKIYRRAEDGHATDGLGNMRPGAPGARSGPALVRVRSTHLPPTRSYIHLQFFRSGDGKNLSPESRALIAQARQRNAAC